MSLLSPLLTARTLRAVFILGLPLAVTLTSYASSVSAQTAAPPNVVQPAPVQTNKAPAPAPKPQPAVKPLWSELTPAQQQALAPLSGEWDKLDSFRKNKWLAIGNKFAAMKPNEQQRVQERMRDWVKLTPEQRRLARESYARAKKLNPDQKSAHWEEYQQLPEEQKKKLAADAAAKKRVTTLPPASQGHASKTIPPIKSASKPVMEQSVTPKAAAQSAIQSSAQPAK